MSPLLVLRESRAIHREKMRGLMNLIVALLSSYISLATVSLVNELFLVRKRYDIISNEIVNTC